MNKPICKQNTLKNHMKQTDIDSSDSKRRKHVKSVGAARATYAYFRFILCRHTSYVQCHTYACRLRCVFMRATRDRAWLLPFVYIYITWIYACANCLYSLRFVQSILTAAHISVYPFLSVLSGNAYRFDSGIGSFFEPFCICIGVSELRLCSDVNGLSSARTM